MPFNPDPNMKDDEEYIMIINGLDLLVGIPIVDCRVYKLLDYA